MPAGFARGRLGAWRGIASYEPGGRARLPQALLARNKRRSERSSRCAARAALDLTGAKNLRLPPKKIRSQITCIGFYNPKPGLKCSCEQHYACAGPFAGIPAPTGCVSFREQRIHPRSTSLPTQARRARLAFHPATNDGPSATKLEPATTVTAPTYPRALISSA